MNLPVSPKLNAVPARMLHGLVGACLFLSIVFCIVHRPTNVQEVDYAKLRHQATFSPHPVVNATYDADILRLLKIDSPFEFRRLCVNARQDRKTLRNKLDALEQPLSTRFEAQRVTVGGEVNNETLITQTPRSQERELLFPCQETVTINVPEFESFVGTNTSSLMLGVATTLKRIEASIPDFSRWLSGTGTPLLVVLVDQPSLQKIQSSLDRIHALAVAYDIELIFEPYRGSVKDTEGLKNFALAPLFPKHRRPQTQWFGVIDDDTFFLSLPRMLHALLPYDPSLPWYMGALTESFSRLSIEGFKAWGGAGVFISAPLMDTLATNSDECRALDNGYGDLLWRDCILSTTSPTTLLTSIPGLNQVDLWGDMSGWYEMPRSALLTLHHWKSWHSHPVSIAHLVADVAGPETLLQRYLFPSAASATPAMSGPAVLTNGYSFVEYPLGVPDLNKTELTFMDNIASYSHPDRLEFHHTLGSLRAPLQPGREKVSWIFEHAVSAPDGSVRQFYVRRPESTSRPVSIVEVDWWKV